MSWKWICLDLQKDEIKVSLENGYMTISAAKGLDKDEQDKKSGRYIRKERYAGILREKLLCRRRHHRRRYQGRVQTWYPEAVCSEEGSKAGSRAEEVCFY